LITAAAAIMIAVFVGFATEGNLILKQVGAGMAVAILVDATVVRMVLVPATMALLGRWNWWLPRWLDRLLPRLDLEPDRQTASSSLVAVGTGDDPSGLPVPAGVR
jgi:RND superfamily putative drug exporter